MNELSNSFVEKIRKLLALATSTNKNEAESAMAKARAMAVERGIELSAINIGQPEENYENKRVSMGQRFPVTARYVFWILKSHFNVKVIQSGNREFGRSIVLLGKESDVQIANYVMEFLIKKFLDIWREDQKKHGLETKNRESYLYGVWKGLDARLTQEAEEAKRAKLATMENAEEVANKYAMVLVSDQKKLEEYVGNIFPSLRNIKGRAININSQVAIQLGKEAGSKIQINKGLNKGSEVLSIQ